MRRLNVPIPAERVVYQISEYEFWIDAVWTIVYFIYKYSTVKKYIGDIAVDVQMLAVLMMGPCVLCLTVNRYVAMVIPQRYDFYFSHKKVFIIGGVLFSVGVIYMILRYTIIDENFLTKTAQNVTTVLCIIAFGYGLESVRSQKRCEWRRQIEDRKLLYLTLSIAFFQLIANIMTAYIITLDFVKTWESWKLTYFVTAVNVAICGAQYSGVILFFLFSQPAKDIIYRIFHCQEPLRNRVRPLAFIE
ncbi:hypothetical protein FO519_007728 [Halicephalobus sp. NKZ332]|nr:hypothetical protein FO519_007728 [Halicephalobus sp. NKZ332]